MLKLSWALAFALIIAPANAAKVNISKKNALIFDLPLKGGQTAPVWIPKEGEPYTDELEALAHDAFALDELLDAEPRIQQAIAIARASYRKNAFAFYYEGNRFVAFDPSWAGAWRGTPGFALIIAHEIGHHVCGHQEGAMRDNPWDKELEADRFGGYMIRLIEKKEMFYIGKVTINSVLEALPGIFSLEGSESHPPRGLRVSAVLEGYKNGSPCADRLPKPPGPWRFVKDDGSEILVKKSRTNWTFVYERPAPFLKGVEREAVFFEGVKNGKVFKGSAMSHSDDPCSAVYIVQGIESDDGREIVLRGEVISHTKQCQPLRRSPKTVTLKRVD